MIEQGKQFSCQEVNVVRVLQPVEGRRRLGGMRIGQMEKDAIVSNGTVYMYDPNNPQTSK